VLNAEQQLVEIEGCDLIDYAKPLHQAVNEEENRTLTEDAFRTFVQRNDTKKNVVCLGLPPGLLLLRQLKLRPTDDEKIERLVSHRARELFSLPLDDLVWDYVPLDERPATPVAANRQRDFLLLGVKSFLLKDRLARLRSLGLPVDIVQSDCIALWNFLAYEFFDVPETSEATSVSPPTRPVALLDIGTASTNLLVASPELAWFRSSGLGGEQFNKTLVREMKTTLAQAEQLKRDPASAPSVVKLGQTLELVCEQFQEELQRFLAELRAVHPQWMPDRILGCGGGFHTHGLLKQLRSAV
jgi:type IV pilus assembly protein PilM